MSMFESIAKTNTTHTAIYPECATIWFESIAKTNTTHTHEGTVIRHMCLRVLLKQIQHTLYYVGKRKSYV